MVGRGSTEMHVQLVSLPLTFGGCVITREQIEIHMLDKGMPSDGPGRDADIKLMLNLLWPLIDAYQKRQLIQGRGLYADEIALFNELKEKLGVKLMGLE